MALGHLLIDKSRLMLSFPCLLAGEQDMFVLINDSSI